jgi:hypothetical protein
VAVTPLTADTSPEIERRQIEGWRQMSPAQKAETVIALTSMAFDMTLAGIRHRHPDESDRDHRRRLAILLHGPDVARRAFPSLF